MLAALGVLFAAAGVGTVIGEMARAVIPEGSVFLTVVVFALGMAVFTMIMGNAFAAFPVMAAAIGVPLLIQGYGGDPAVVGAIGMLAGFCGTLMTPMAANFNLVPAALLELKDRNAVVKVQVGTAPFISMDVAAQDVDEDEDTVVAVKVVRTGNDDFPVSANFKTVPGTARNKRDYITKRGTVNFAPGVDTQTINVKIVDNGAKTANREFDVVLTSPVGALLHKPKRTTVTIHDND
jgi:hypothetical protein